MPWVPIHESGVNYEFFAYFSENIQIEGSTIYGSTSPSSSPEWRLSAWEEGSEDPIQVRVSVLSYSVVGRVDAPGAIVYQEDPWNPEVRVENERGDGGWSPTPIDAVASAEYPLRYAPADAPTVPEENYVFFIEVWSDSAPGPTNKRITFEAIGTEPPPPLDTSGQGHGRLPISGYGFSETIAALGAAGFGSITLRQVVPEGAVVAPPAFGDGFGSVLIGQAYSYGPSAVAPAHGDGHVTLQGIGFEASDVGFGVLPIYGFGESVAEGDADPPPVWQDTVVFVGELIDLAGRVSDDALHLGLAHDAAALAAARANHRLRAAAAAREALRVGDELATVFQILVEEGVRLQGQALADHTAAARAVERLVLTGLARSYSEAAALVTDGLVFEALVDMLASEQVVDEAVLGGMVAGLHSSVGRAVATALLDAQAAPAHTGVIVLADAVLASSAVRSEAELRAALREAVGFSARLHLDNDEYIAWVLNTESAGLSRYTNYPFNSFARVGERYYGLTSGGLFRLDGGDDVGEPINARIRTGMFDFGDRVLKGVPEAYVGYASDGTLLLRTIFAHPKTGEKTAADYRLVPRGAATTRENRFEGGRGVFSVDWSFELENVDGADFELESIEFRPVALSRRVRG